MLKRIKRYLTNRAMKANLKKTKEVLIMDKVAFENTVFEGRCVIRHNSAVSHSVIGIGTYISQNCNLRNVRIGRYCSIASDVKVVFGRHPVKQFVSTHPAFFSTLKQSGFTFVEENKFDEFKFIDEDKKFFASIGNDVWIGQQVMIMEGVRIGDGAVIGAGSIVTKDVEPYSINVGIPAKKVGTRFNDEQIERLEKIKWWDRDFEWLKENASLFSNIEDFLNNVSEK